MLGQDLYLKLQVPFGVAGSAVPAGSGASPASDIVLSSYESYLQMLYRCTLRSLMIGFRSHTVQLGVRRLAVNRQDWINRRRMTHVLHTW